MQRGTETGARLTAGSVRERKIGILMHSQQCVCVCVPPPTFEYLFNSGLILNSINIADV